jgi:hypothetical protein
MMHREHAPSSASEQSAKSHAMPEKEPNDTDDVKQSAIEGHLAARYSIFGIAGKQ